MNLDVKEVFCQKRNKKYKHVQYNNIPNTKIRDKPWK